MTKPAITSVSGSQFSAVADCTRPASLSLVLEGTADTDAMRSVETLLSETHTEASRLGSREVTVDLRRLEFMNSSCFKVFVTWLTQVQNMDTGQQYRIRFLSDPNKHWQRRSLHALSCFAVDLVRIDA